LLTPDPGVDSQSPSLRGDCLQERVHLICRFALEDGSYMRIEIHRHPDLRMTQQVHDHTRVNLLVKEE